MFDRTGVHAEVFVYDAAPEGASCPVHPRLVPSNTVQIKVHEFKSWFAILDGDGLALEC